MATPQLLSGAPHLPAGHALQLLDERRFRAASHLYDKNVVSGQEFAERDYDYASGHEYPNHSLESPAQSGAFAEASAAYVRMHEKVEIETKPTKAQKESPFFHAGDWPKIRVEQRPKKTLTKFARLLSDLKELREAEPNFHAVIFTRFDEVQQRLVQLIGEESKTAAGVLYDGKAAPLKIFEFNKQTQVVVGLELTQPQALACACLSPA